MMDNDTIRKNLEEAFDIPFVVHTIYENREPAFFIAPEDPGKELFTVRVSFRNKLRLTMDFIPQKYSVNFIHSMGKKTEKDRAIFYQYYMLMKKRGAKGTIKVNGLPIELENTSSWPNRWNSFEARITKIPVVEDGELIYSKEVNEWGSLMVGMILSLADIVPVENELENKGYKEGDIKLVESNRYERNPLNRKLCLAARGYNCNICGFDFENVYGEIGHNFIHVHHIVPVSKIGPGYIIDPMNDLVPVCANCHAMLHRCNPPLQPEHLKKIMINTRKNQLYNYTSQMSLVAEPKSYYGSNEKDHTINIENE